MSVGHDSNHHGPGPYSLQSFNRLPVRLLVEGLCTFEIWYPELWDLSVHGETPGERDQRRAEAMSVCQACPVRALCASFAEDSGEIGIWGGRLFRPTNTTAPHPKERSDGRGVGAPPTSLTSGLARRKASA